MLRKRLSKLLVLLILFGQLGMMPASAEGASDPLSPVLVEESGAPVGDPPVITIPPVEVASEPEAPPVEPDSINDEPEISVVVDSEDIDLEDPQIEENYFVVQYEDGTIETRMVEQPEEATIMAAGQEPVDIEAAMEVFEEKSDVEIVEPLMVRYVSDGEAASVPDDTYFGSQWGPQAIHADDLYNWSFTSALSTVTIAVLDTGMHMTHPDLAGSLASVNRGDGVMVSGYDAVASEPAVPASMDYLPDDNYGHGTHCAGIAAAIVNNGTGISGVAGGAKILPVKVLADNGRGTSTDVAEGIKWAADHGADIISMSLGSSDSSQIEQEAVDYAYGKGVVVIAASGNDSHNWATPPDLHSVSYPAAYDHVIGVGSVDGTLKVSNFSNSGSAIDIVAPGENIASTMSPINIYDPGENYLSLSGTSMATPHVAGAAALILAEKASLTPVQVEAALKSSANNVLVGAYPVPNYGGKSDYYGVGIVDVYQAITTLSTNTPQLFNLEVNTGSISFSPATATYSLSVGYDTTTIGIRPTANNSYQTITVNGTAYSGTAYQDISLNPGVNAIAVTVRAKDGITLKDYTVTVTRSPADASLSGLSISQGTLSPAFSGSTLAYSASVSSTTVSLDLTANVTDPHSTVTVNGSAYIPGTALPVALSFGANVLTVVTDAHGVTKTYTLTVTRAAASADATLSALEYRFGAGAYTVVPDYSGATLLYEVLCPSAAVSVPEVRGTATNANATVLYDQATHYVSDSEAVITVTAQNGTTVKTYHVKFTQMTAVANDPSPQVTMDSGANENLELPLGNSVSSLTLTIPEAVAEPTLTVPVTSNGTTITSVLPALAISRIDGGSSTVVSIPVGTTVSAPSSSNWDGTIALPVIKATPSVGPGTGTVETVVEVGFPGSTLTFNKAVRLLIPGMAGKSVGYVKDGSFHLITTVLDADNQAAGDALTAGGEGKVSSGTDLVVWTKHFTEFVAFTPAPAAAPAGGGGGGGGGGGAGGAEAVVKTSSVTVMEADTVKITFAPNSHFSEFKASMNVVGYSTSPFKGSQRLMGKVYVLYKNIDQEIEKPMEIAFTVKLKDVDLAKERLALFYLDPKANLWKELAGAKVDPSKGVVTGSSALFTEYAVLAILKEEPVPVAVPEVPVAPSPQLPDFTDMTGHWASDKVNVLVAKKAISGYPDGSFRPEAPITRGEFLTVLVKAQGMTGAKALPFSDAEEHWARDGIRIGYANGVTSGFSDGLFHPNDPITREQMAAMVNRTLRYASESPQLSLKDQADISPWAMEAIRKLIAFKIMGGYPDGTFRPQGLATRAEAATVILKTITN